MSFTILDSVPVVIGWNWLEVTVWFFHLRISGVTSAFSREEQTHHSNMSLKTDLEQISLFLMT